MSVFYFSFAIKFLRLASLRRTWNNFENLMAVNFKHCLEIFRFCITLLISQSFKLTHVTVVIVFLFLRTLIFIQWCLCAYKAVASSVFFVRLLPFFLQFSIQLFKFASPKFLYSANERSESINNLLSPNVALHDKYFYILDFVIWALFDTSFGSDIDVFIPGKMITSGCMIIGLGYNIYILIQILNIMNIVHTSRTKFYEVMNQLDAYMQKRQLPLYLQNRLKFFYKKKFRHSYYREDEILGTLSETLQREILINTEHLFVERLELFKDVPKYIVSSIAASCRKEQFLPNDMILKAGSVGDCMFFIGSGTVCITTTTGKELMHLTDGDHFGEVALILKNKKVWFQIHFNSKNCVPCRLIFPSHNSHPEAHCECHCH